MNVLLIAIQLFIAAAMFDVWWFRYDAPGRFRGGDATTMEEEFRVYGLPDWLRKLVRVLKLGAGVFMILGIWRPELAVIAGGTLVVLMIGAVLMHLKVKDPLIKAFPSFSFGLLSAYVAYSYWTSLGM